MRITSRELLCVETRGMETSVLTQNLTTDSALYEYFSPLCSVSGINCRKVGTKLISIRGEKTVILGKIIIFSDKTDYTLHYHTALEIVEIIKYKPFVTEIICKL